MKTDTKQKQNVIRDDDKTMRKQTQYVTTDKAEDSMNFKGTTHVNKKNLKEGKTKRMLALDL